MKVNESTPRAANLGKKTIAAATTIAVALASIMLLMFSCTSATPANDANTFLASDVEQSENAEDPSDSEQESTTPGFGTEIEEDVSNNTIAIRQADDTHALSQEAEVSDSSPHTHTSEPTTPSNDPTPTQSQKAWVEDTERIWVVDTDAWTESVPVYSTVEVSICNVCGADVTGNATAHGKAHMLAGEGSGHHSEVRQTITGYNTVHHEAKGHYEERVVGGHWE